MQMGSSRSGNRTARRGTKPRQRLTLSKEAAATLRTLIAHRHTAINEEAYVEELIAEAWLKIDQEYQAAAEESAAWEGEIL
jgi:hypothetical protein